jgi:hypothetical protein
VGIVADENLREASYLLPELDFFATEAEDTHADEVIDYRGSESFEDSAEDIGWKACLLAANDLRLSSPFHLADLLKKVAKVDAVDVNFELALPSSTPPLPDELAKATGVRIGVCTSSLSQEEIESALEALSQVCAPIEIFLLGTLKERKLTSSVNAKWDGRLNIYDLSGQLGLVGQAAVLRTCDINVVGPGLSAILSSGFGTFTVCIEKDATQGPFLYPYGHGHLVIQRAEGHPFSTVLSSFLTPLITFTLSANSGNVPTLEQWQEFADSMIVEHLGKIRLLGTQRIETLFQDSGSLTELYQRPLLFTGSELHDIIQTFYRLLLEHSLSHRTITTFDLQILHQDAMPQLCQLLKPLEQLYELANFGQTYSKFAKESLSKGDVIRARQESARIQEVEELMQALVSNQPYLRLLYATFRQEQHLLVAESPIMLAGEMADLFSQLQERVLVLLDLAKSLFHTVLENESAVNHSATERADSNG